VTASWRFACQASTLTTKAQIVIIQKIIRKEHVGMPLTNNNDIEFYVHAELIGISNKKFFLVTY
jgi:hypothetical protein